MTRAALCALALVGCIGSDYRVQPDAGFSGGTMVAAHAAAADWMANVPVKITFADAPCPPQHTGGMVCMHPVAALPSLGAVEPGQLAGLTIFTDIWLVEPSLAELPEARVQRLIAHEMGHAMGLLDAFDKPGTLMYPYGDKGALMVQPADVAQWYAVRGQHVTPAASSGSAPPPVPHT